MIAGSVFTNIFGMIPPGDDRVVRVAKAAAAAGFAVVACKPGQKVPMCTLTARQAVTADRQASYAAGRKVRHACGIAHATTDPAVAGRVFTRLVAQNGPVNLGVELGASRMLVVDVDTREEREAFLSDWTTASGQDQSARTPTVLSPGALRVTDSGPEPVWVHKDGGHFWFTLPDGVTLPTGSGVLKHPSGWTVMWADHQVLVPPSTRPEGPYRLTGQGEPAPDWLTDMIIMEADARSIRMASRADRAFDSGDPLERWSAITSWSALLEPDDWTSTGLVDTCSCPIWTAPGAHASPKSATAHDVGCTRFDVETGWGPLHVWTDNPPPWLVGRDTWTKVGYLSARDHAGNHRDAMVAVGILAPDASFDFDLDFEVPDDSEPAGERSPAAATVLDRPEADEFDLPGGPEPDQTSATTPAVPGALANLPDDFWSSRVALKHIRTASLAMMCSPDALFVATLARLAAMRHHRIVLDIGLGETGLNLIVCPVGPSSSGKGIAMAGAGLLIPRELCASGAHDGIGIGSGEGIAEAYMGREQVDTGETYKSGDRKGQPKMREVRAQVRHNALFALDEGQALGQMSARAGTTIVTALRSAWSCATIGQANAREDTTRSIPAGTYSAGFVLAFQLDTAASVLADTDGLAQRALWASASHPGVTADMVEHPGALVDVITGCDPFDGGGGGITMTFPLEIRVAYREHRAGVLRGEIEQDPLDGHGPLVRAKVAALLALLDGRVSPAREDVELAGVVWRTSCRVRAHLTERSQTVAQEAARALAVSRALPIVIAQQKIEEGTDKRVEQSARTLSRHVHAAGPDGMTHRDARKTMKSTMRGQYDAVRDHAEAMGWIVVGEGSTPGLVPGGTAP